MIAVARSSSDLTRVLSGMRSLSSDVDSAIFQVGHGETDVFTAPSIGDVIREARALGFELEQEDAESCAGISWSACS